jgi:anti-sigma regulatory factor (Ser/Thr protein kinase)
MDQGKSAEFVIAEKEDCVSAQQSARRMARAAGFPDESSEEIAIAVAELSTNLIKHAGRGVLTLRALAGHRQGIEIEAEDQGPGIMDLEKCFADGYSTSGSLGYGLGTVNRLMDELDVRSSPGPGTHIVCRKWMRPPSEPIAPRLWDVGVMTRSRGFTPENGDAFIVKRQNRQLLVGVIDGLGHGEPAQAAALAAQGYVEKHDDLPLDKIFLGAGRACRATRGVVMALARFSAPSRMSFASVGNVEARVCGGRERIGFVPRRGIVGVDDVHVSVQEIVWNAQWVLVMHTDGVRAHWQWDDFPRLGRESAKEIASRLMRELAVGNDDATVLTVKAETP